MVTASAPSPTSCELGGHVWDLKYTARALRHLQMTMGSLEALAQRLINENMGTGMSLRTQALLIWAGQRAVEPKIKLGWVKWFLESTAPQIRLLLVTWAAADFCRAVLEIAEAKIAAALPEPVDPDDEDGEMV